MTEHAATAADHLAAAIRQIALAATQGGECAGPDSNRRAPDQSNEPASFGEASTTPNTLPLAGAPPLLLRLEPGVRFVDEDAVNLQPRMGAAAVVGSGYAGRGAEQTRKIWLSAAAWDGIAAVVRQTPKWHRENVATFLELIEACLHPSEAFAGLLAEVIDEVRTDPYTGVGRSSRVGIDFIW